MEKKSKNQNDNYLEKNHDSRKQLRKASKIHKQKMDTWVSHVKKCKTKTKWKEKGSMCHNYKKYVFITIVV